VGRAREVESHRLPYWAYWRQDQRCCRETKSEQISILVRLVTQIVANERLAEVRKTSCIEYGEEICPRRENGDGGKGLEILKVGHAHIYGAIGMLTSVDFRISEGCSTRDLVTCY
jgi:hypothetical protein